MRWYEYKMEADDLHAPEDLKAKLLAMADTLPEEEKNRPMMPAQADNTAVVRPQELPKKVKLIHFPAKQVGALAACLAVCVVGYGALSTGKLDIGAKSSNMALYSANSSAASTAGGFTAQQAMLDATPEAAPYDLGQAAVLSETAAAAAEAGAYCEVSLERMMSCGVGACNTCKFEPVDGMKGACMCGPVFDASKVVVF